MINTAVHPVEGAYQLALAIKDNKFSPIQKVEGVYHLGQTPISDALELFTKAIACMPKDDAVRVSLRQYSPLFPREIRNEMLVALYILQASFRAYRAERSFSQSHEGKLSTLFRKTVNGVKHTGNWAHVHTEEKTTPIVTKIEGLITGLDITPKQDPSLLPREVLGMENPVVSVRAALPREGSDAGFGIV